MDQAQSYAKVHSFVSVGPSTLACGIWVHLSNFFLSLLLFDPVAAHLELHNVSHAKASISLHD